MPSSFTLRRFGPNDLSQVMRINQICLPENYSSSFFTDLYEQSPEAFIVAEEGGRVVGYIMCRLEGGFSGFGFRPFSTKKKGHVISVAVLPEHRNKGVGRSLLREALQAMLTHHGAEECYLEVRVSNTEAVDLYEKSGFKIERTARGYYADGEDAYIMSSRLKGDG